MTAGHQPLVQLFAGRIEKGSANTHTPCRREVVVPTRARQSNSARIRDIPMCPSLRPTKSSRPASSTKRIFNCAETTKISAAQPTMVSQLQKLQGLSPRAQGGSAAGDIQRTCTLGLADQCDLAEPHPSQSLAFDRRTLVALEHNLGEPSQIPLEPETIGHPLED